MNVNLNGEPTEVPEAATITDTELAALPLTRHDWHGDWNYTLTPNLAT